MHHASQRALGCAHHATYVGWCKGAIRPAPRAIKTSTNLLCLCSRIGLDRVSVEQHVLNSVRTQLKSRVGGGALGLHGGRTRTELEQQALRGLGCSEPGACSDCTLRHEVDR